LKKNNLYNKTLNDLSDLTALLAITPLKSSLLNCINSFYPAELFQMKTNSVSKALTLANKLLTFLELSPELLIEMRSDDYEAYTQHIALRHFFEREFLLSNDEQFILSPLFWEKPLGIGILWKLYTEKILTLKEYNPNQTICAQGSREASILFNLTSVDIYFNKKKVNAVVGNSLLGEGGILGISRSTEIRTPNTENGRNLIASLDCKLLQKSMPKLFAAMRLQVFLSFLEKLQQGNVSTQTYTKKLKEQKMEFSHLLKPKQKLITEKSPLDTFEKSKLMQGITTPGKEGLLRRFLGKLIKVEEYPTGKKIIVCGAEPEKIFVIHSGKLSIRSESGEILGFTNVGEVIGESIITGTKTIANIETEEPSVIVSLYRTELLRSPLKKYVFSNCFKILQQKLIDRNQLNTKLVQLLKQQEWGGLREENQDAFIVGSVDAKVESPDMASESFKMKSRSRALLDPRLKGVPESKLQKVSNIISESLHSWLGGSVIEKDNREFQEHLEKFVHLSKSGRIHKVR